MSHNGTQTAPRAEVTIIGAGPIGIELAIALKEAGLTTHHFEAKQVGYAMTWWPRETNFFSTSERIAIAGIPIQNTHQGRTTGEVYLAYLRAIVEQFDLKINTYEPVTTVAPEGEGFTIHTAPLTGPRRYRSRWVVLAKGDMDRPNLLNIPGEDLPNVTHYFDDPHTYFRRRLLVVGGRNSAAEAALRCWRAGAEVTLSYRQKTISERIKDHIRPDLLAQIEAGTIGYYPETVPLEITPSHVVLQPSGSGEPIIHPTDFVLLNTGFRADMSLYEQLGIELAGPQRVPVFNPDTMETNLPGLLYRRHHSRR